MYSINSSYPYLRISTQPTGVAPDDVWGRWLVLLIGAIWAAGIVVGFQTSLTVIAMISIVFAVVGLRWPAIGLLGCSMLCTLDAPMRVFLLTGGVFRWNTFNYLLLAVMALSVPFLLRLSDIHTRLLQLLLLLLSLELLISPNRSRGILNLLNIIIIFGLLCYFARVEMNNRVWYWVGVVNGALAGAGSCIYYLQRAGLPEINPNAWAYFPVTALFTLCLALPFTRQKRGGQLVIASLAVLNGGWVFLSGSRGSLLNASICMLFILAMVRGLSNRMVFLMVTGLFSFVMLTQFTDLQTHTVNRLNNLFDSTSSYADRSSGRYDLVLGAWYIFSENPLGVGTGGFADTWAELGHREGLSNFRTGVAIEAHSAWASVLAENGIPGFILFAGYVLSFAVVGVFTHNHYVRTLGLLVTIVLGTAFLSTEFVSKGLWFLAAGATVLLHRKDMIAHLHSAARRTPITNIIRPEEPRHD